MQEDGRGCVWEAGLTFFDLGSNALSVLPQGRPVVVVFFSSLDVP